MNGPYDISNAATDALLTGDAREKATVTRTLYQQWQAGTLPWVLTQAAPTRPGRPESPRLLPPNQMPKRGKAGSTANRIALIHALAHIELNAIDLAWDIVIRYGATLPQEFTSDWLKVADDEARHFLLLDDRLRTLGSHYGALPAHDGLWEAALETSENLAARLAIVPMVLEARGLDVSPGTIKRLRLAKDDPSADILEIIYHDEISHVSTGVKWFFYYCREQKRDPESEFKSCVAKYFRGILKPPFNDSARAEAGFPEQFYKLC